MITVSYSAKIYNGQLGHYYQLMFIQKFTRSTCSNLLSITKRNMATKRYRNAKMPSMISKLKNTLNTRARRPAQRTETEAELQKLMPASGTRVPAQWESGLIFACSRPLNHSHVLYDYSTLNQVRFEQVATREHLHKISAELAEASVCALNLEVCGVGVGCCGVFADCL